MIPFRLVFLIGYRGTGKTTVARLLADKMSWSWLDADAILEKEAGNTIRHIFATEGEQAFREKEALLLKKMSCLQEHVIATGGGIVLRPDNRAILQKEMVVWLQATPESLYQRLQQDATTRERRPPLAQGGLQEIMDLMHERAPLYAACQRLTVETSHRSPEEVAETIFSQFRQAVGPIMHS